MKHKHPTQLPPYCAPPVTIVMAADGTLPPPARFDGLRRPLRHIYEQFKTLTGWGLHHPRAHDARVTRHQMAADAQGIRLSYLIAGDPKARRIVFIHGSPGQGDDWQTYLSQCPPDQCRIAMDRAGYGASQPADPVPTIAAQACAIAPLLTQGCIIVAHSYGAPVALRLALDRPDLVAGLLLIACPVDPDTADVHPLQRIAAMPMLSRFVPRGLHASNIELLPFQSDLRGLLPALGQITAQVTVIHGLRDTLVPASDAALLATHLAGVSSPRQILLPDGDHYLPWSHHATIEQALDYVLCDCAAASFAG